jgi:lipopolysaccharide transport system permease protein
VVQQEPITIIEPHKGLRFINMPELWAYRELLFAFVIRDLKVRYKQTVIGAVWAILQPLSTMVVFTFFFGTIAKINSDGVPYPIFSYSGLILWTYFTGALSAASNSMVGATSLITKVYFPRVIIPLSATLTGLVDYLVAATILAVLLVYYAITPPLAMLLLPFLVLLTWLLASGLGMFLAAVNVKYHDVKYAVPFFIQLMLFFTPVIYPISIAPNFKTLLMLNPMTGIIEAHRALILGNIPVNLTSLGISIIMTILIFIGGAIYFRSVEKYFADII